MSNKYCDRYISCCALCGSVEEREEHCFGDNPHTILSEKGYDECKDCQNVLSKYPEFISKFRK